MRRAFLSSAFFGVSIILFAANPPISAAGQEEPSAPLPVYTAGENGYHTYRIPSLFTTPSGTLLAFCEGRKESRSDAGDIDMLVRRSTDGGATWSAQAIVWDDDGNTCGNPCPVFDESTGVLWLLMTWNLGADKEPMIINRTSSDTRRVFVTSSSDEGLTWRKPIEITKQAKKEDWSWYATGPGVGIQLRQGPAKGRLVIPCDHIETESKLPNSHVIFSDDHGTTWALGGSVPGGLLNECQVVELRDGKLMINMRNHESDERFRGVAVSSDSGITWQDLRHDAALPEPHCQASLIRNTAGTDCLAFSNPSDPLERKNMTVKASLDDGVTWPAQRQLHAGPAAYSCLSALPGGNLGILYEAGEKGPYDAIVFQRFSVSWLLAGTGGKK